MKHLLLFLACLSLAFNARATHGTGGEITYDYIGDSTGVPHHYAIEIILYKDASPNTIDMPITLSVCISNSCYSNANISLTRVNGNSGDSINNPCQSNLGWQDTNSYPQQKHIYRNDVILPGKCADYTFSYQTCCRNLLIDNLQNPGGMNLYIEAQLNNSQDNNDSPEFKTTGPATFCLNANQSVIWSHAVSESDGDSLHFQFHSYQNSNGCPPNSGSYFSFKPNYSETAPFSSATPIQLDPKTGLLSFSPLAPEVAVVRLKVMEYRADASGNYLFMGSIIRDVQLSVIANCITPGDSINFAPLVNNTLSNQLNCGDSTLELLTTEDIDASSLSPDGSEFRIFNGLGQIVPITSASFFTPADSQYTSGIRLQVYPAFWYNDTLKISFQKGSDQNALINSCGFEISALDTMTMVVNGCNTSVGQAESKLPQYSLYPQPAGGELTIILATGTPAQLVILDLQGRAVLHHELNERQNRLDISNLPSGSYLLKLTQDDKQHTQLIIKS